MMSVIVDQEESLTRIFNFKATARVLKFSERRGNFLERNPKFRGQRNHADGVVNIVFTGHV